MNRLRSKMGRSKWLEFRLIGCRRPIRSEFGHPPLEIQNIDPTRSVYFQSVSSKSAKSELHELAAGGSWQGVPTSDPIMAKKRKAGRGAMNPQKTGRLISITVQSLPIPVLLLVVFAVVARPDAIDPFGIGKVPVNRLAQSITEIGLRQPAKFTS